MKDTLAYVAWVAVMLAGTTGNHAFWLPFAGMVGLCSALCTYTNNPQTLDEKP